jgi:hypothetical protein
VPTPTTFFGSQPMPRRRRGPDGNAPQVFFVLALTTRVFAGRPDSYSNAGARLKPAFTAIPSSGTFLAIAGGCDICPGGRGFSGLVRVVPNPKTSVRSRLGAADPEFRGGRCLLWRWRLICWRSFGVVIGGGACSGRFRCGLRTLRRVQVNRCRGWVTAGGVAVGLVGFRGRRRAGRKRRARGSNPVPAIGLDGRAGRSGRGSR